MLKAALFDYDDTLVTTMQSKWAATKETAQRFYGLEITDQDIAPHWGKPYREMIAGVMQSRAPFEELAQNYLKVHHELPMRAHSGALETIKKLVDISLWEVLRELSAGDQHEGCQEDPEDHPRMAWLPPGTTSAWKISRGSSTRLCVAG